MRKAKNKSACRTTCSNGKRVVRSTSRLPCQKVDINKCSRTTLRQLQIPKRSVDAIIQYRRRRRCFTHINELLRLKPIDAETFTVVKQKCKVDNTAIELRQILHSRRRHKSIVRPNYQEKAHTHKTDRSRSGLACNRQAANRCRSSHSTSLTPTGSTSTTSSCSKRNAVASKSIASMLSGLWGGATRIGRLPKTLQAQPRHLATGRRAIKSLSKTGSDSLSNFSSTRYDREYHLPPAPRGNPSTTKGVSDVRTRSVNRARSVKRSHTNSRVREQFKRNSGATRGGASDPSNRPERSRQLTHHMPTYQEYHRREAASSSERKESCMIM